MELEIVLAFLFGVIHRGIRVLHERLRVRGVGWEGRNADAGRNAAFLSRDLDRLNRRGEELARHLSGLLRLPQLFEEHHELVAAEPRENVASPQGGPETGRDFP